MVSDAKNLVRNLFAMIEEKQPTKENRE